MPQRYDSGLSTSVVNYIVRHRSKLSLIPDPPQTFTRSEIDKRIKEHFAKLHSNDIIVAPEGTTGESQTEWMLNPQVYETLEELLTDAPRDEPLTPCCRYVGWSNERDGDYRCRLCGEEFTEFVVLSETDKKPVANSMDHQLRHSSTPVDV